jgi:hypothetical protein
VALLQPLSCSQPSQTRPAWRGAEAAKLLALDNVLWGTARRPPPRWLQRLTRGALRAALSASSLALSDLQLRYIQVSGASRVRGVKGRGGVWRLSTCGVPERSSIHTFGWCCLRQDMLPLPVACGCVPASQVVQRDQ